MRRRSNGSYGAQTRTSDASFAFQQFSLMEIRWRISPLGFGAINQGAQ